MTTFWNEVILQFDENSGQTPAVFVCTAEVFLLRVARFGEADARCFCVYGIGAGFPLCVEHFSE